MNILLQVAGICIMAMIFIFYFVERKSAVRSNQLFLYQAIAIFASLVIDIISLFMINRPNLFNIHLTKFVCKLYLSLVILVVCLGLVYVLGDIEKINNKFFSRMCMNTAIALFIGVALVFSLPINIVYDPDGLNDYTEGLPIIITYAEAFLVMAVTVGITLYYRNVIYKKRVIGVLIFIALWVLGSAVQGIINYMFEDLGVIILSVSLSEAMGSLVIYIMLENPSLNEDKITGALNQRAFREYVDLCMKKKLDKEFILINYDIEMSKAFLSSDSFAKAVTNMLGNFNVEKIFRNDRNDFIVTRSSKGAVDIHTVEKEFKRKFFLANNITTEIQYKIIHFNDLSLFYDADDFMDALRYLNDNINKYEKQIIEITPEIVDEVHKKFILKKKCDTALANKRISVFFQPIFSNHDNSFTAAEALVRLIDEDGKLIYPSDFVEDMEKDGKIIELGKIVFEDACKFISENDLEKLGLHYIEVNLSTIQCMQDDFVDTYIKIAKKYKVDPKYINLEITETGEMSKLILLKNMEKLKEYGFTFSLDDFGTGNANLNYIVDMPVDIVKFDKTMVSSYFKNGTAYYVMNSAISMIKGLGYKIVFEGVETYEQIRVVNAIDVEYVQGFYYSQPIDKDSFIDFLRKNNNV